MTLFKLLAPPALLCLALSSTGCEAATCGLRTKTYEGGDVLPGSDKQADSVIAALEAGETVDVTWDPPKDFPLDAQFPKAPFHGPDELTISFEFDDAEFYVEQSYDFDYGECSGGAPVADVMLALDSKSGHMRERVPGVVTVESGGITFSGSLAKLSGPSREFQPESIARNQQSEVTFNVDMNDQGEVNELRVLVTLVTKNGNQKVHTSRPVLSM